MRITSSKRDDILREREEYQAQYDENERIRNEEHDKFRDAEHSVIDPIKENLEYQLGRYNVLTFDIRVDRNFHYGSDRGVEVDIKCNERDHFADDNALSWNFDVKLSNDGDVIKETGSWSGLKATTPAQLKSLRQSVSALEYLNDVDWTSIIDVELPKYEDYLKTRQMPNRNSEFNQRLLQADLEELVGSSKFVKVANFESSGYRGRNVYVRLLRETPSQYVVQIIGEWEMNNVKQAMADGTMRDLESRWTQRVKKSNIKPVTDNGNLITEDVG